MRNRLRGILFILLGFVLIGAGLVAVYFLFTQQSPTTAPEPTQVPVEKSSVVVLTHDMFLGDLIRAEDVTVAEIPTELVPRDAIKDVRDAVDRYVKADMVQGEMLFVHNLADPTNINHDLAFILSEEHVLVALPLSDLMTTESVIQRGDLIDIFVTRIEMVAPPPAEGEEPTPISQVPEDERLTRAFTFDAMQKVGVTALVMDVVVDEEARAKALEANPNLPPSRQEINVKGYLLALKPQDALILKYFKDSGAVIELALRNPRSSIQHDLTPVTQEFIVEYYGLEILP